MREVPEKLHLLYPKVLAGRFEISSNINSTVEVQPASRFTEPRQIDIDQVRQLVMLCLRLEALSSGAFAMSSTSSTTSPGTMISKSRTASPMQSPRLGVGALDDTLGTSAGAVSQQAVALSPSHNRLSNTPGRQGKRTQTAPMSPGAPPLFLGPHVRDDMTDEELCVVIESLVTRIENSMSSLVSSFLPLGSVA